MSSSHESARTEPVMVRTGSRVELNFALRLASGETVDSTFDSQPAELVVGDGNLPDGFERCLLGMSTGGRQVFTVPPEQAFGQHNTSNVQLVPRERFAPDMSLTTGLVVSFADPSGGELPGVIKLVDEQSVTVDFNHPLAGETLSFEVEILSVRQNG